MYPNVLLHDVLHLYLSSIHPSIWIPSFEWVTIELDVLLFTPFKWLIGMFEHMWAYFLFIPSVSQSQIDFSYELPSDMVNPVWPANYEETVMESLHKLQQGTDVAHTFYSLVQHLRQMNSSQLQIIFDNPRISELDYAA